MQDARRVLPHARARVLRGAFFRARAEKVGRASKHYEQEFSGKGMIGRGMGERIGGTFKTHPNAA